MSSCTGDDIETAGNDGRRDQSPPNIGLSSQLLILFGNIQESGPTSLFLALVRLSSAFFPTIARASSHHAQQIFVPSRI
jgi:hypothetical protein